MASPVRMRIISGMLRGRTFESPGTNKTHPMSERMRGALFNSLGDVSGLSLLDCFGGSGALSFEALSRGAANSVIVEIDKTAHQRIKDNAQKLGLSTKTKITRANVSTWSDNNQDLQFNLVLCNPPFDGLKPELIQKLTRHVKPNGLFVISWPNDTPTPEFDGFNLQAEKEKEYGSAMLAFYRKTV